MEQEKPISDDHYLCISFLALFSAERRSSQIPIPPNIYPVSTYNELKRNNIFYLALRVLLDSKANCGVLKRDSGSRA